MSDKGRILVVDDTMLNRVLLATSLKNQGYQVDMAEDGQQALDKLNSEPYDAVLLDLMMPVMDGYQVLEAVREDDELSKIPIIMVSAVDQMESVVRCIKLGAIDHMPKPFEPSLLQVRVNTAVANKKLREKVAAYAAQYGTL